SVARDGYSYQPGLQSNVNFSPLYPLLVRLAGSIGGGDAALLAAGLLVSNLALVVALGYLVALTRRELDAPTATRTALYLLAFPSSLFLSLLYPESLFLALGVAATFHSRQRRWWLAGLLA